MLPKCIPHFTNRKSRFFFPPCILAITPSTTSIVECPLCSFIHSSNTCTRTRTQAHKSQCRRISETNSIVGFPANFVWYRRDFRTAGGRRYTQGGGRPAVSYYIGTYICQTSNDGFTAISHLRLMGNPGLVTPSPLRLTNEKVHRIFYIDSILLLPFTWASFQTTRNKRWIEHWIKKKQQL